MGVLEGHQATQIAPLRICLRRENKRLTIENEILSKAAAWFARETNSIPDKRSNS